MAEKKTNRFRIYVEDTTGRKQGTWYTFPFTETWDNNYEELEDIEEKYGRRWKITKVEGFPSNIVPDILKLNMRGLYSLSITMTIMQNIYDDADDMYIPTYILLEAAGDLKTVDELLGYDIIIWEKSKSLDRIEDEMLEILSNIIDSKFSKLWDYLSPAVTVNINTLIKTWKMKGVLKETTYGYIVVDKELEHLISDAKD